MNLVSGRISVQKDALSVKAVNEEELQDALQQWNKTVKGHRMNLESKGDRNTAEDTSICGRQYGNRQRHYVEQKTEEINETRIVFEACVILPCMFW